MLPASGAGDGRGDAGDLAADRADEGPGGRAERQWHCGSVHQQHASAAGRRGGAGGGSTRTRQDPVHRAGAAGRRGVPTLPERAAGEPDRHRRGALHLGVGARVPAGLPQPAAASRDVPADAAAGADGDGDGAGAAGHRGAARPQGGRGVRVELQPREPELRGADEGQRRAAAARAAGAVSGECGHRVLLLPAGDGGRGGGAHRSRVAGEPLPRGTGAGGSTEGAGGLHPRPRAHHRRDHRVRHGRRQAGRAARGAHQPAEVGGELLPGDGTGRSRRAAERVRAAVLVRRQGAAGVFLQKDGRRGRAAERAGEARPDGAVRAAPHVPAPLPAGVLRRAVGHGGLRQLRRLPGVGGARGVRRDGDRAEGAVGGGADGRAVRAAHVVGCWWAAGSSASSPRGTTS